MPLLSLLRSDSVPLHLHKPPVMAILQVQDVSKRYGSHQALSEVSLQVPEGSIYGLLGPNGAGKSTLIRIIVQIISSDTGEVFFRGQPMKRSDIYRIGYMPEERGLYRKMKVEEQIVYFAQLKGMSSAAAKKATRDWMARLQISDWRDKKVEQLSKGMAQKIQLIATIIHQPPLLILDEPFSGFDPVNAALIKDELLALKESGTTIILSTHRMEQVEELCDSIALINRSRKVVEGEVQEVRQRFKPNLFEVTVEGELAEADLPEGIEVLSRQPQHGALEAVRLQAPENMPPNTLLKAVLQQAEVHGFREVLPSINDIFIELVNEKQDEQDLAHHQA